MKIERERDRERHRERERETDRQTDRQTETERERTICKYEADTKLSCPPSWVSTNTPVRSGYCK